MGACLAGDGDVLVTDTAGCGAELALMVGAPGPALSDVPKMSGAAPMAK